MTYIPSNKHAKNYCNLDSSCQVIINEEAACFLRHSVVVIQGVPEKPHKVTTLQRFINQIIIIIIMINLEPFAIMKFFASKCSAEITVYQSMQNLCKWLNSRKWLHTSAGQCAILQTNVPDFIELSKLTHPQIIQLLCALQQLVCSQKFKDIDHLKQVLNSYWDMISLKLINWVLLNSHPNDCWLDILNIANLLLS